MTATARLAALALVVLLAALVWHFTPVDEAPRVDPSAVIGKPAPQDTVIAGRVTVVNFFASWCVPCRAEHPLLQRLAKRAIAVVGIAYKDKPDAIAAYLEGMGDPYTRRLADPNGEIAAAFAVTGVPDSFLIDQHGRIRYRVAGPLTETNVRELLPLAERLARAPDDSAAAAGL